MARLDKSWGRQTDNKDMKRKVMSVIDLDRKNLEGAFILDFVKNRGRSINVRCQSRKYRKLVQ